jgi:hypothetical protein
MTPCFTEKCKSPEGCQNLKAIYRFLSRAIIYYMQNVEVHAGSPGYLNLMTTQECLATLLVRVSYPGDLASISLERLEDS